MLGVGSDDVRPVSLSKACSHPIPISCLVVPDAPGSWHFLSRLYTELCYYNGMIRSPDRGMDSGKSVGWEVRNYQTKYVIASCGMGLGDGKHRITP